MSDYQVFKCPYFCENLIPFTKLWGIFTSVVLFGVGADLFAHHHWSGLYIILATVVIFFLEIAWVITVFLKICLRDDYSVIFSCWNGILWIKHWKKTIIYIALSCVLLFQHNRFWLSSVAGVMLICLGLLHFLHYWVESNQRYSKEPLLNNEDDYYERSDAADITNAIPEKDEIRGDILNNYEHKDKNEI